MIASCRREPVTRREEEADPVPASEPAFLWGVKTNSTEVEWKCFFRASPSINHSNYLPQPQECAGRAAPWPLPRWEALWGLGGSTENEPALGRKKKVSAYLWGCKKPTQQFPLGKGRSLRSPRCPFGFTEWAKQSISLQHLFYRDFGKGAKSPSDRART